MQISTEDSLEDTKLVLKTRIVSKKYIKVELISLYVTIEQDRI